MSQAQFNNLLNNLNKTPNLFSLNNNQNKNISLFKSNNNSPLFSNNNEKDPGNSLWPKKYWR